jgi:prevent-host-death family protein
MEQVAISKFKATCLALLEEVRKTREPILITRFGKPVAQIVPPAPPQTQKRKLGGLAGSIQVTGDIVSPPDEDPGPPEVRW